MEDYTSTYQYLTLLAQRVQDYRLAERKSQRELAEASGVSLTTIFKFEQGKGLNMTLRNFINILRALGMDERINELLPELPMKPMQLREIEKYIPKRVRRKGKC